MYAVSEAFLKAVKQSHTAVTEVVVIDADTGTMTTLQALNGTVTLDRTRDIRGSFSATLTDPTGELTPQDAEALLAPFGNEIRIRRGVVVSGGTEYVPLGIYRINSFSLDDGPNGLIISLSGTDRSIVIQRNRIADAYVVTSGVATETAMTDLAIDRFPGVELNLPSMGTTTAQIVLEAGADPWRDGIRAMAKASGMEAFFDGNGQLTAKAIAAPTSEPLLTYEEGEQAVILDLKRNFSTESQVYNGVIATGESTSLAAPVRGEAWDEDPSSPTYHLGPFGKVPRFYSSPLILTEAQAESAALSLLSSALGTSESVSFTQIGNPALEPGDVIRITRTRAGITAINLVIDAVTIPLNPTGAMTVSGRRRFS